MKRILITGGAGYIGSVITNLALQQGFKVRVIDTLWFKKEIPLIHLNNPYYEFVKGDIRDYSMVNRVLDDIDYVINAAAVVGDPASKIFPELTSQTNFEAFRNIIELSKNKEIKGVVFLSTCSNYGTAKELANEETELLPQSLYAQSKVQAEKLLMDGEHKLDWIICRLSTVYGISPRMRFDLTVNDFTMNAFVEKNLDIFLPYSNRPYIHVYDAAKVIIELLKNFDSVKNNVFNIGFDGENYQKIEIANIVKEYLPDTKIEIVKSGHDLRDYRVDFSKLNKFLNLENTYTVRDGVKEVYEILKNKIITDYRQDYYYNTKPDLNNNY